MVPTGIVARILLSTVVYRDPETVFPYLESFTEYPRYTDYLNDVREYDGNPADVQSRSDSRNSRGQMKSETRSDGGTTWYDLHLSWWKLRYTARSEVFELSPPHSLKWKLRKDIDAEGEWRVEPEPEAAPTGEETASRIYFDAQYDPHSANSDAISLPRFVSMDWVIRKIQPRLFGEVEKIVRRLVADIEGTPRDVELYVHERP